MLSRVALRLTIIAFDVDRTNKPRALPEGAFCGAGIEQLCLPIDFHNIGLRACENCKSLVEVNLMSTEVTALLSSTFAHCIALQCIWLPPRLIGKEVFLNCVVLQEVVIPTELSDTGNRAFCGCEQLQRFTLLDWGDIEQWVQAEHNAFLMCNKFEKPEYWGGPLWRLRTLQRFWTSFLGPPAEHVLAASVVIQLFWHGVMMDVLHAWCFFVGRLFVVRPFGWVEGVALRGQLHIWWVACVVARWGLLRRIFRTIC